METRSDVEHFFRSHIGSYSERKEVGFLIKELIAEIAGHDFVDVAWAEISRSRRNRFGCIGIKGFAEVDTIIEFTRFTFSIEADISSKLVVGLDIDPVKDRSVIGEEVECRGATHARHTVPIVQARSEVKFEFFFVHQFVFVPQIVNKELWFFSVREKVIALLG